MEYHFTFRIFEKALSGTFTLAFSSDVCPAVDKYLEVTRSLLPHRDGGHPQELALGVLQEHGHAFDSALAALQSLPRQGTDRRDPSFGM